jgi:hypothetical protein
MNSEKRWRFCCVEVVVPIIIRKDKVSVIKVEVAIRPITKRINP